MTDPKDGPESTDGSDDGAARWLLPAAAGLTCAAGLLVVGLTVWSTYSSDELPAEASEVAGYALTLGTGLLLVVIGLVVLGRPRAKSVDVRDELVSLHALLSRPDVPATAEPDPVESSWLATR